MQLDSKERVLPPRLLLLITGTLQQAPHQDMSPQPWWINYRSDGARVSFAMLVSKCGDGTNLQHHQMKACRGLVQ